MHLYFVAQARYLLLNFVYILRLARLSVKTKLNLFSSEIGIIAVISGVILRELNVFRVGAEFVSALCAGQYHPNEKYDLTSARNDRVQNTAYTDNRKDARNNRGEKLDKQVKKSPAGIVQSSYRNRKRRHKLKHRVGNRGDPRKDCKRGESKRAQKYRKRISYCQYEIVASRIQPIISSSCAPVPSLPFFQTVDISFNHNKYVPFRIC